MKNSFIIYHSYKKHFKLLTNEQKGILFDAFLEYSENQTIPELEPVLMMAFNFVAEDIDINRQKWEDMTEVRSEAGKKGAAARWGDNKDMAKDGKRILSMAKNGKHAVSVSVSDSVNVSDIYLSFIKEFNRVVGTNHKPTSKVSRQLMARLKEGYVLGDILKAVKNARGNDFLMGKNENKKRYLTPSYILREDKLDEWSVAKEVEKQRPTL